MLITAPTEAIEIVTGQAVSTDWTVLYQEHGARLDATRSGQGNVVTATTTVIIPSPPTVSIFRRIRQITVVNRGGTTQQVYVQKNLGSGTLIRMTPVIVLAAGESLFYEEAVGYVVLDASGFPKVSPTTILQNSAVQMSPHFATANLTTVKALAAGTSYALYMGKAPRALASARVRFRCTTLGTTISWAELALATGAIVLGGSPTLTPVGFADLAAVVNTTGQKTVTVSVSAGQSIITGDDLWIIIAANAIAGPNIRAVSIADDIQVGMQATAAARPSAAIGFPVAFTIEAATTPSGWFALIP